MKSAPPAALDRGSPQALLTEAIAWAVRLGSGDADAQAHEACKAWRAMDPSHEHAWQRVQSVENAFLQVPAVGTAGRGLAHDALQAATREQRRGRRRTLGLLGFAAIGGMLGHGVWRAAPWLHRSDYATATGERRRVMLEDGTELYLNTGSEAQVVFSPLRRLVVLRRGEMHVRTGNDAGALWGRRAFWVEAPHARFEALGTRFGVRQQGEETRLSMTEGRVAIHVGEAPAVIAQAGDGYVIRAEEIQRVVDRSFEAQAWTEGALVARQMRLDAFLAELARYRGAPLHCDVQVAAMRVSGVFQIDGPDPVGRALEALVRTLPVRLEHGTGGAVTVARR